MMREMTRKQVLVQLDDAQVTALDSIAAGADDSRSELIRRAIDLYLEAVRSHVEDVRYAAAYERLPDDPAELEAMRVMAAVGWPSD
jgi:metal-responsive CopG/Arc/MetJ family transcriptional regulator